MKATITHGYQEWKGRTMAEAKRRMELDLASLFSDARNFEPLLIFAGGGSAYENCDPPASYVGVVHVSDNGNFGTTLYTDGKQGVRAGPYATRFLAERAIRRHLAQLVAFIGHDGAVLVSGEELLDPLDSEGLSDHRGWLRFQSAWSRIEHEARLVGVTYDKHTHHRLACEAADLARGAS